MSVFHGIPPLLVALTLAAAPGGAQAGSLIDLPDPAYSGGPRLPGAIRVEPRITRIVYPTLGLTALVHAGESFVALVHADCPEPAADPAARSEAVRAPRARLEPVGITPALGIPLEVLSSTTDPAAGGITRLELGVPVDIAADLYDLVLEHPTCFEDRQPSSVRVHRVSGGEPFRFVVLSDQQISDPTGRMDGGNRHPGLFPAEGEDTARRLANQVRGELEFLDPLFVLYPGDLIFGMDYTVEYPEAHDFWSTARLGLLAVPGNHDGYAAHRLGLSPNWLAATAEVLFCGRRLLDDPDLEGIFNVLSCLLKRLHGFVEGDLEHDGLELWRRFFGPERYAVRVAGMRLIGINTYGGSTTRRASVALSLDWIRAVLELVEKVTDWDQQERKAIFDRAGAPLVDNYGGFLDTPVIDWVRGQLEAARAAGELPVLFGHHDPRGNLRTGADQYEANQLFPTNPFGLGDFEVWNFDDGNWESDPADRVGVETEQDNSGTRLLAALAAGPAHIFFGHAHHDLHHFVRAGGRIPGTAGLVAEGDLHLVQTTTGGASVYGDDAYRGYRIVDGAAGKIERMDYSAEAGWGSVPAGNFWVEELPRDDGPPDRRVTSVLPLPLQGRLRFVLPDRPAGFRFSARNGETEQTLPLEDLTLAEGRFVAHVGVQVPGTGKGFESFPPPREALQSLDIGWQEATGNRPPAASILTLPAGPVLAGAAATLSASDSRDPEGEPLFRFLWEVNGRRELGERITARFDTPGRHPVTLTVFDDCGARSTITAEVAVETEEQRIARQAMPKWKIAAAVGAMLLLVLILLLLSRRRDPA